MAKVNGKRFGDDWKRRMRRRLWEEQGGLCHWCKQMTYKEDDPRFKRSTGALSGKAATLDHLYSKLHPLRHKSVDHFRYVMACSTCNGQRSKEECLAGMQQIPDWRSSTK